MAALHPVHIHAERPDRLLDSPDQRHFFDIDAAELAPEAVDAILSDR